MVKFASVSWLLLSLLILVMVTAGTIGAQSLGFNVGWYESIDPPRPTCIPECTIEQKPSYSFGFYPREIVNTDRNTRLGLQLSFARAKKKSAQPGELSPARNTTNEYLMSSFLFSYQRLAYHKDFFYWTLGVSGGPSFRSSSNAGHHEVPFSNLRMGLSFQPGTYFVLNVYKFLAIQISARYNYLMSTGSDFYPFSSGFLLEGGLLLVPRAGK